jgi:cytochrome P450
MRQFDVNSPEMRADRYSQFRAMREEARVVKLSPFGLVAITRYDDVAEVLRNPARFSNHAYTVMGARSGAGGDEEKASISHVDPPEHTRLRNLIMGAFTPRMVETLEPRVRALSSELVDRVEGRGEFDVVADLAGPLPVTVIAELLGVDLARRDDFTRWSYEMTRQVSLTGAEDTERIQASRAEMEAFLMQTIDEARRNPKANLIGDLVQAQVDGARLTDKEIRNLAFLLLIAGIETTARLVANTWVALTDYPEEQQKVRANRSLIPNLIEETLRFHSPSQCLFRQATADVDLFGAHVPKGAIVVPLLASANRDDKKFADPDRFDVTRGARNHLAFGLDIHFCLGASLARLEAKAMLESMFCRFGRLERKEDAVDWDPSFFFRSPRKLVLRPAA